MDGNTIRRGFEMRTGNIVLGIVAERRIGGKETLRV